MILAAFFVLTSLTPAIAENWGYIGSYGMSQLSYPWGIGADKNGNIYVSDQLARNVRKYSAWYGTYLGTFTRSLKDGRDLVSPRGVCVDKNVYIYVADYGNPYTKKFTSNGSCTVINTGSCNDGAIDKDVLYAFVVDPTNNKVKKFYGTTLIKTWGTWGSGNGQFKYPSGIAYYYNSSTGSQSIYVSDYGNNRIQRFNVNGAYISQWGNYGTSNGQFNSPQDVACDAAGNVFVADTGNYRIQKFSPTGTWIATFGSYGQGNGQFGNGDNESGPTGIAIDPAQGHVWATDPGNNRFQRWYQY